MEMKNLIKLAVEQYSQELREDAENTDAKFFIAEELADKEGMDSNEFDSFCSLFYKELNSLGIE
jgi:hypothetical protein